MLSDQPENTFPSQEAGCQANMSLEEILFCNQQLQMELDGYQKQRAEEREISKKIQQLVLSYSSPPPISNLSLHFSPSPSLDVDGDFVDFYQISPSCLDVLFGNVMGKGLPAAVIATLAKTQFARFALPAHRVQLYHHESLWRDDLLMPDEIVGRVLKEINGPLTQLESFISLFYGRFDFQKQLFSYVNCGFAAPLYFQSATEKVQELIDSQPPLGVTPEEVYQRKQIPFGHQDLFLFYSDSILRTQAANGEFFKVEHLRQLLHVNHALDTHLLRQVIEEEVAHFFAPMPLHDSFTVLVIKIPEIKPNGISGSKTAKFYSDLEQAHAVRQFIQSVFDQVPGDNEQFVHKMQLCVHEAFCNLIHHAYANQPLGEIIICCEQLEEGGVVEIADQGCEFDPAKVAYPNFCGDDEHGFGWYIIRELTDQVTYVKKNSSHGWNHLRIFKKYIPREVPMNMSYKKNDGILVITFEGDHLDAKSSSQCKEYILDLIKHKQIYSIILDLHELKFIDSSGLGTFLSLLKELNAHGGELKLAEMTKTVRTVFELVCMHKIFDIFPTIEDALKEMREHLAEKK